MGLVIFGEDTLFWFFSCFLFLCWQFCTFSQCLGLLSFPFSPFSSPWRCLQCSEDLCLINHNRIGVSLHNLPHENQLLSVQIVILKGRHTDAHDLPLSPSVVCPLAPVSPNPSQLQSATSFHSSATFWLSVHPRCPTMSQLLLSLNLCHLCGVLFESRFYIFSSEKM